MAKKGGGAQTVTQKLDAPTAAMQKDVYAKARDVAGQAYSGYQGPTVAQANPYITGAANQYQQLGGLAGLGGRALGGDQAAFAQFMNPYQHNVIDAVGQQYNQLRDQAHLNANDAATQAHAFGGSRHAIMEGAQLGQLDQGQAQTVAGLQQQGFADAQQRALQAANLGMGALGQQSQIGDYLRQIQQQQLTNNQGQFNEQRDWGARQLGLLQGAFQNTPYGQSQSQPTSQNKLAGVAGGALTGFEVGGPIGGLIGGGLGLLGI